MFWLKILSMRRVCAIGTVLALFGGVSVLTGCAVGPDYRRPAPPDVKSYTAHTLPARTAAAAGPGGSAQSFVVGRKVEGAWWSLFHSPELDRLISVALAHNPSLVAAQNTLLAAQDQVRVGEGAFFPSLSGSVSAARELQPFQSAGLTTGKVTGRTSNSPFSLLNAGVSVSYAPDVFGGVKRQVEGLEAVAQEQRFALEAAYLALTANVVTAAVTDASLRAQIVATKGIVAAERHELQILQRQVTLGGAAESSVMTQQALLAQTLATLPPLENQLAQTRNQLAAYEGAYPADFHDPDFNLAQLHLPHRLPVSLPSELVRQRPDIREAAAVLHQDTAAVGVATANMLPQITLSGSVGHEALTAASLFTPETLLWNLAAGVVQPLFEGGSLFYQRRAAIATMRAAAATYQDTVILAFQNVSDVLVSITNDARALQADREAETATRESLDVAEAQYRAGAVPYTTVLTAEQSYEKSVIIRIQATAQRYADTAALFQALGGGWWQRKDVASNIEKCCGVLP